jgi:hypothetical protein
VHLARAQRWHVNEARRFMIVFVAQHRLRSATFALLLKYSRRPKRPQTTRFVVSLLTELAVVMVLRTEGPQPVPLEPRALGRISCRRRRGDGPAILGPLAPYSVSFRCLGPRLPRGRRGGGLIASTEAVKIWFFRRHAR